MANLSTDVLELRAELIALRRELHQHPEPAYAETRTAARIVSFLEGSGLRVRTGVGGTGVLATAGGLVFQGSAEGQLAAYSTRDGRRVWSYDAGNGIIAAPATYAIDGEQFLAVMVGFGGAGPMLSAWVLPDRPRRPGRLLVFKLGGTATVTPYPRPEPVTIDLTGASSAGDATAGLTLYNNNCLHCHGPNASGRYLPDLKTSPMLLSADAFKSVVIDGARAAQGMVSFSRYLTADQAESIRAYILTEARKADTLALGRAEP